MPELLTLSLDAIEPSPHNPRQLFDPAALAQLAHSIQQVGLLQPIMVQANPQNEAHYVIVAGERRWRACRLAGLTQVPALVLALDEPILREAQLMENLEREPLNSVEEARALHNLLDEYGYTQAELARHLGRSIPYVRNRLDILLTDPVVQQYVANGQLTVAAALELGRVEDPPAQRDLAGRAVAERLTAEETRLRVERYRAAMRQATLATQRQANWEAKRQALAAQGVVITLDNYDPRQHHRTWDLYFAECELCPKKGKFLRADGQVEDVCVEAGCYTDLLAQYRATERQGRRDRRATRQQAFAQVLAGDAVTTAHLRYLLWTMLHWLAAGADPWRRDNELPAWGDEAQVGWTTWARISAWADEDLLAHILYLCVSHLAVLETDQLPPGLKQSLIEEFAIAPRLLGESAGHEVN